MSKNEIIFSKNSYRYIICVYNNDNEKSFYTGHDGYNKILSTINIWSAKKYFSRSDAFVGLNEALSINACNHDSNIAGMTIAKVFMSAPVKEEA